MTTADVGPHLPPPVLLGVFFCVLHHVLNVVFAEASRRLDHDCRTAGDLTSKGGVRQAYHDVSTTRRTKDPMKLEHIYTSLPGHSSHKCLNTVSIPISLVISLLVL